MPKLAKDLFAGKLEEAGGSAGMECCSSVFNVDHSERNKRAFEGVELSLGS